MIKHHKKTRKVLLGARPWTEKEEQRLQERMKDFNPQTQFKAPIMKELAREFGRTPGAVNVRYSSSVKGNGKYSELPF